MKETEVAEPVRDWLKAQGWGVYCEVTAPGGRYDLVGVRGALVWVIEVKTSLSMGLLAQALDRRSYAHFVSIAIPTKRHAHRSAGRAFAERVCRDYGVGVIHVTPDDYGRKVACPGPFGRGTSVDECSAPDFRRRVIDIRSRLYDAQRDSTPGAAQGGFVTPFTETVRALKWHVSNNPGCTVKEAMASIRHHYRSATTARACVARYIRSGAIEGVRLDETERPHRLFLGADT